MGEPNKNLNKVIIVTFMIGMILFITGYATDYWTDTDISHNGLWRHCTLDICTEGGFSDVFNVLKDDNLKFKIRKKRSDGETDTEVRETDRDKERERENDRERNSPEQDEGETKIRTQKVVVHHVHRNPIQEVREDHGVLVNTNIENNEEQVEENEGIFALGD